MPLLINMNSEIYCLYFLLIITLNANYCSPLAIEYVNGNNMKEVTSPSIPIKGHLDYFTLENKTAMIAIDGTGCSENSMEGALDRIVIAQNIDCDSSTKIRNAYYSGAAGLILIWNERTVAGFNVNWGSMDITEEEGIYLPVVEVILQDGEDIIDLIESGEELLFDIKSGDANPWKDLFESNLFFIWQILLVLIYLVNIGIGLFKLRAFCKGNADQWKEKVLMNVQVWMIFNSLISSLLGLSYVSIDPIHSHGIFNASADLVLTTFSFPSAFLGTFLMTLVWIKGFTTNKILDSKKKVILQIVKLFASGSLLFQFIDVIFAILRGNFVQIGSLVTITALFYIAFPLVIIILYAYVTTKIWMTYRKYDKKMFENIAKMVSIVKRNFFVLGSLYFSWIAATMAGIWPFIWTPVGRPTLFFLYFAITAFINMAHMIMTTSDNNRSRRLSESGFSSQATSMEKLRKC